MLIDFKQVLTFLDGRPIRRPGSPPKDAVKEQRTPNGIYYIDKDGRQIEAPTEDVTLDWVCIEALLNQAEKEEVEERYDLSVKISKNPSLELSTDEIVFIKKYLKSDKFAMATPLILGRACSMLEGKEDAADTADK